jgi:hypothetical protein
MSITVIGGGIGPTPRRAQGSAAFAVLQNRTTGEVIMQLTSGSKPSRLGGVWDSELAKS